MESNGCRKSSRYRPLRPRGAYQRLSLPPIFTATELDREVLGRVAEHLERQIRWSRRSMAIGLFFGTAALVVGLFTAEPLAKWSFLAAAALELCFVPCYTSAACRRLQRIITFISLDLKSGLVGASDGKVRSLFGVWRVIEDSRTGRLRRIPAHVAGRARLPIGTTVAYRFALRSGVVLSVKFLGYEVGAAQGLADDAAPVRGTFRDEVLL